VEAHSIVYPSSVQEATQPAVMSRAYFVSLRFLGSSPTSKKKIVVNNFIDD